MCLPLDKLQSDRANKTTAAREARQKHVLRPSPLSSISISTWAYLPPSPHPHMCLFSTSKGLRRNGRGREDERNGGLAPVGQGLCRQHGYLYETLTSLSWQILVNTIQPSCFSSLIMKIHGPACLHVNSYRYESYISAHISIFLHLDIDSCNVLTLCNP